MSSYPGPPPKPTVLKKLAGNPGKRKLNDREPHPPKPAKAPYAPRYLTKEAQKEWRRIVPILMDLGLFTEVDMAALSMYCQAFGRWVHAERMVDETGGPNLVSDKGNLYQNPWVWQANSSFDQARRLLAEFGLTPASRSRLKVAPKEEQDELEALLRRRNIAIAR